jgi:YfiH family protein
MSFIEHKKQELIYHTSSLMEKEGGIVHGFSTRLGGVSEGMYASLSLRGSEACEDTAENVAENYRRFCAAAGGNVNNVVLARQVHEDTVRIVTAADAGKGLWQERDYTADALITNEPGLPLFIFSADCIIILLSDSRSGAVGAVHAGWRGTALGIVKKAVEEMGRAFGTRAEDIRAAIGAGIGSCCFETHDDVPDAMRAAWGSEAEPFIAAVGEKWQVDLKGINRRLLTMAGVKEENIDVCPLCTACHPELYWSHRKMGNARGVQAGMIMKV